MKTLFGFLYFFLAASSIADETDDLVQERFSIIEAQRKSAHTHLYQTVAAFNYTRMKLLTIEESCKSVEASIQALKVECKDLMICKGKLDSLFMSTQLRITEILLLETSSSYPAIIRLPINQAVALQDILQRHKTTLNRLSEQIMNLRREVGVRFAEAEYARMVAESDAASSAFKLKAQCQLEPLSLERSVIKIAGAISTVDRGQDPFIVLQIQGEGRELKDRLEALHAACADKKKLDLVSERLAKIDFESLTAKIPQLFQKGCEAVKAPPTDIQQMCADGKLSDFKIYSLHRTLAAQAGGK